MIVNNNIGLVKFRNEDVKALYHGTNLVWENDNTSSDIPNMHFCGKFTDDSDDFYWCYNVNNEAIYFADDVDPLTKRFDVEVDENIKIDTYSLDIPSKYEEITKMPYKVTALRRFFYQCVNLKKVDLSAVKEVTVNYDFSNMFYHCTSLTSLKLANLDTSNVTDMSFMFWGCLGLKSLNLSKFDTSNVVNMKHAFAACGFTYLDVSNFDVSNVTNMSYMFSACENLTTLNLGNWDVKNVTTFTNIFSGNSSLTTIIGPIKNISVNISLYDLPLLSNESAMVFINGLKPTTSKRTIEFYKPTFETLSQEQIAIATSKGWTVTQA